MMVSSFDCRQDSGERSTPDGRSSVGNRLTFLPAASGIKRNDIIRQVAYTRETTRIMHSQKYLLDPLDSVVVYGQIPIYWGLLWSFIYDWWLFICGVAIYSPIRAGSLAVSHNHRLISARSTSNLIASRHKLSRFVPAIFHILDFL